MYIITILARDGIRANIHAVPGQPLAPVIQVETPDGRTLRGLGAVLHGPASVVYAVRSEQQRRCGVSVWIESEHLVEIAEEPIIPASSKATHIHTDTIREKQNRKALREQPMLMVFQPALAVRSSKSAKATKCMTVRTSGA
ncbi:MAG: hypothetical protein RLZZ387_1511, partial [Chloroflexota bacterium]